MLTVAAGTTRISGGSTGGLRVWVSMGFMFRLPSDTELNPKP